VKHIYLSPHLDDAVLSCGGAIHRATTAGEEVVVVTVFAGEAGTDVALSPFALAQHGYWGNPPKPMTLRRGEDAAALALLGAEGLYLDHLDAVYRTDASGQSIYPDLETLMGEVHPDDPMTQDGAEELASRLAGLVSARDQAVLYAPLGVGHHVDHQIVHAAAGRLLARGYRLAFYEDYPYAERPGAVEAALSFARTEGWRAKIIALDPADVTAKVSALGYYRSQLPILFGGVEAMPNRVWAFAAVDPPQSETGLAERLWWPR
jgi:LmbE family N-acetylglucosaminyl deacetylase